MEHREDDVSIQVMSSIERRVRMSAMQQNKGFAFRNPALPLSERIEDLLSQLTVEEKVGLIPTSQSAIERLDITEYGVGGEAAHGIVTRNDDAGTVFPMPIGLACTWNPQLMKQVGSAIGDEARAYQQKSGGRFGLTLWAPTVDMERDPRWGRTEEAYGEDPYLTGRMSTELVKGMQGDHPFYIKLAAALKHFYGNNNELDRIWCSSSIDARNKYEYYLKAFEPAVVEGKVQSMMTAYNEINGVPAIVHPDVQQIVKDQWGMDGFIVCDGGDMLQTVDYHHYYESHAETVAHALKAGVDCMTDEAEPVREAVFEALERGLLTENDLDHALRNILKVRFRLGHFDPIENNPYAQIDESVLNCEQHRKLALQAAQESIVLLKNERQLLPLDRSKLERIAVVGPCAGQVYRGWYTGTLPYAISPLEAITSKLPEEAVSYHSGDDLITLRSLVNGQYIQETDTTDRICAATAKDREATRLYMRDWGWDRCTLQSANTGKFLSSAADDLYISSSAEEVYGWFVKEQFSLNRQLDGRAVWRSWDGGHIRVGEDGAKLTVEHIPSYATQLCEYEMDVLESGIHEAVEAARGADAAVVMVGNHPLINAKEEIDRTDISLPPAQERLIREVLAVNPNTIVVIVGGYPFALNGLEDEIPTILFAPHGGQEAGQAIADVLFGDYSPAGRLNMTWYPSTDQLPAMQEYDIRKGKRTYWYFDGEPLYSFGHGLTYTTFDYSEGMLNKKQLSSDGMLEVSIKLHNTGERASDEVVQLYVRKDGSRVERPFKQLKAFQRIHLKQGEEQKVNFKVSLTELAYWDVTSGDYGQYRVEPGAYTVMIGSSSSQIKWEERFIIEGEQDLQRSLAKDTRAELYDDYEYVLLDEDKCGGTCLVPNARAAWAQYRDVLVQSEVRYLDFLASSALPGGWIQVRRGDSQGPLLGQMAVPDTGGIYQWERMQCPLQLKSGVHDITLVFDGIRLASIRLI